MSLPRSDDEILILHNPRCSKSRAALALLAESGHAFEERRYLDEPLNVDELSALCDRLGVRASELVRRGEDDYARAGLDAHSTEDEVLAALARFPRLLQRPIVVRGGRAVVGRPPEDVGRLL